jgi:hypothetical protein
MASDVSVQEGWILVIVPRLPQMHAWHTAQGVRMRLERRLRRLLRKRGIRLNEDLRQAVRDFAATVSEQNPDVLDPDAVDRGRGGIRR